MIKKISYLLIILITGGYLSGCIVREPASNGSQDHTIEPAEIIPDILISQLPLQLHESSGLIDFKGLLWTMNDSGGEPALYGFDMINEEVKQVIRIVNGENVDWESLTSDKSHIYIGDFGNNWGKRTDLKIYIISKSDIPDEGDADILAEQIEFVYPDQDNFVFGLNNNPYDCEAFICYNETLYLFSKDWVTRKTRVYSLPATPGAYTAELVDSFNVDGLVTGADISMNMEKLVLLGYKDFTPFIWSFEGIKEDNILSGKKTRFMIPEYFRAQTEGIMFSGQDTLLFSSEYSQLPARIYRFILP